MKKEIMEFAAVMVVVVMVLVIGILMFGSDKGIVVLKGWGQGVAFCGNEFPAVVSSNKDHTWYNSTEDITFVVNAGHINDKEVKELEAMAITECNKLKEENK